MARCAYCGVKVEKPITCPYCGKIFCVEHGQHERHKCTATQNQNSKNKYSNQSTSSNISYSRHSYSGYRPKSARIWLTVVLIILGLSSIVVLQYPSDFKELVFNLKNEASNIGDDIVQRFTGAHLICKSYTVTPYSAWIGENITVHYFLENTGDQNNTYEIEVYLDDEFIESQSLFFNPKELKEFQFTFYQNISGSYLFKINGLDVNFSRIIVVEKPDVVLDRPDYYYSFARKYVKETYGLPEDHSIESLFHFLSKLQFPVYSANSFDCSDSSALLEWLLEGAGFQAYLVENDSHMWVQVITSDGLVAIEATNLCSGESYGPPGIVDNLAGDYEIYTYEYNRDLQMFLDWKEKYPSSVYDYDPNITFEEWKREYLFSTSFDWRVSGIPSVS
ncbi:hypothetical protein KQH65_09420, partial [archaeon]|nr:hypothetical protein [archaeon]